MPIKGVTDLGPQFPQIGELRKGAAKETRTRTDGTTYEVVGRNLKSRFRFTSTDPEVLREFTAEYGEYPERLPVLLPFASVEANYTAWQEEWIAGGLVHRCDGETVVLYLGEDGAYHTDPRPCPYLNKPKSAKKCKAVGRLKVVLPGLGRLAYVLVATTSFHDVKDVQGCLEGLFMLRGRVSGIPLTLSRYPKRISTPGKGGKRVRRLEWLIRLEVDRAEVAPELEAQMAAARHQIPAEAGPPAGAVITPSGEVIRQPEESPKDEPNGEPGPTDPQDPPPSESTSSPPRQPTLPRQPLTAEQVRDTLRAGSGWARDARLLEGDPISADQRLLLQALLNETVQDPDNQTSLLTWLLTVPDLTRLYHAEAVKLIAWVLTDPGAATIEAARILEAAAAQDAHDEAVSEEESSPSETAPPPEEGEQGDKEPPALSDENVTISAPPLFDESFPDVDLGDDAPLVLPEDYQDGDTPDLTDWDPEDVHGPAGEEEPDA